MDSIRTRKVSKRLLLALALLAMMAFPIASVLAESISGDNVIVESGETLEKTSFLSGENVRIEGDINGTTFITGSIIEVNGTIDGDLFVVGQNLIVNGTVKGSIFLAGQDMTVNGVIENNMYSAGQRIKIQSQTDGSVFIAGQNIFIEEDAVIERDVFIGGSSVYQNGVINGDLKSSSDSIGIGGKVAGDLNYSSRSQADFADSSEVLGETTWEKIEATPSEDSKKIFSIALLNRVLLSIGAALIVWLVVRLISPTFWMKLADEIVLNPLKTIGFGALGVVFIPIVSILLMFTLIGIPLSLIMLSLYGIALYSSKIIVSVYLSYFLQDQLAASDMQAFWLFLLALSLLMGFGVIPIVGVILGLLTISLGVGSIGLALISD